MPKKPGVNVVKHPEGWAVKRDNAARASGVFPTQDEAIERGREIARNDRTELRIQDRQGRWRDSDSYGNDPPSIVDQKH